MILFAYTYDPVCLLFFHLVEHSLSLNLVLYEQAHNSQGLKSFRIQSYISFNTLTEDNIKILPKVYV